MVPFSQSWTKRVFVNPFLLIFEKFWKNMTWRPTGQKSTPKMKVSGVDETPQKARPPQKYLWMEPIVDLPIINLLLPRCFYFRHASEGGISLDGGSKLHIFGAKNNFKQQFLAVKLRSEFQDIPLAETAIFQEVLQHFMCVDKHLLSFLKFADDSDFEIICGGSLSQQNGRPLKNFCAKNISTDLENPTNKLAPPQYFFCAKFYI